MVTVTVLERFRDLVEHVDRNPGDTFDVTKERAEYISAHLPGYVTYTEHKQDNFANLSNEELRELATKRGIDVPKKVGRARLISLLEE